MATSESQIRNAVVSLLRQQNRDLNTTEVKALLHTVVNFDNEDLQMSPTRAEPLVIQRIGNIVSHQNEDIAEYNGFKVDKTIVPAIWSLT